VPLTVVLPPSLGAAKATARAELLEAALARDLGEPVTAVVASTYAELEARAAEAPIVWAPAAVCAKLPAARAVFTIVRRGRATYRSALVGLRERGLTIDKLVGTRAAWVDPLSAGGYLLVAAMLRERGLDPERTFAVQSFLGSHRAAVEAVLHGSADVTAVSVVSPDADGLAEMLRWYAGPAGDRLTAIELSEACPNDAIVITTAVPEGQAARLADKLLPATPAGRARSRLLTALEAEGLVRGDLDDYRKLRTALVWAGPRTSQRPPRSR
jgi:phosphonate transport system substrate-binding protein